MGVEDGGAHGMKHLQPEARPPRALVPWKKGGLSCGDLGFDHCLGWTLWLTPHQVSPVGLTCRAAWKHQQVTF